MIQQKDLTRIKGLFATSLCGNLKMPYRKVISGGKKQISSEQFQVLDILKNRRSVTQKQVCELTYRDKPSVTRLIDKLEIKGFVRRMSDKTDRRVKNIVITELGIREYERFNRVTDEMMKSATEDIDDNQLLVFNSVLNHILNNLALKIS